jgi:uncharacterized protein DUF2344
VAEPEADFPVTLVVRKGGDLRWLGHLDFARAVARALRRTGLALRHSGGFHPRPRIQTPEPLPVGVGSDGERFVVAFAEAVEPARVVELLARQLPRGLEVVAAERGARPEPRDAPLDLRLESPAPGRLAELLARLAGLGAEERPLGAPFEVLPRPFGALVRVAAPAGERPSAGRFLSALKPLAQAAGVDLSAIDREVPSFAPPSDLQSRAPFSTPEPPHGRSGTP